MQNIGRMATALIITALSLGGCATTQHEFTVAEFASVTEPIYPSIDIFRMRSSEEFRAACTTYDRASMLKHCELDSLDYQMVADEFAATGHFESAELASRNQPYSIAITSAVYNTETAGEIGTAALAGATLMLVPIKTNAIIKVEGEVRWHSGTLHEFAFDLPFTLKGGWMTFGDLGDKGLANSVVASVMHDLESSKAFSPEHLHATVQSSDYQNDLQLPLEVGGKRALSRLTQQIRQR